jgi:serine protease Do
MPSPAPLRRLPIAALILLSAALWAPPSATAAPVVDLQKQLAAAGDGAMSALVNIQPITETFNRGEVRKRASIGSGFLIDTDGHIVTNHHVAGRAKQLMVTLSNKERVEAELIGEDPSTDLAVIRIDPALVEQYGLKPLAWGSSGDLATGQFVLALGSPLALARTMTFGVVSNKDRYLPDGMQLPSGERTGAFNTWIQTDAAINPGNSGGPLIDLNGLVVGVNARGAMFADNIGFAIPADVAKRVTADLIEHGEVRRSYAGITFQPLKDWAELFGLKESAGVLVASVEPGSPAAAAGLQAGDLMLAYGDLELKVRFDEELPPLHAAIADTPIGTTVSIRLLRKGEEQAVELTTTETGRLMGDRFEAEAWGFTVKDITVQMSYDLELDDDDGVLIEGVRVGGPAHRGQLRRGLVLERIEGEAIVDLDDFKARYETLAADGSTVLLQLRRYDSLKLVLVKPKATRRGAE